MGDTEASNSNEWGTPRDLYYALNFRYPYPIGYQIDLAASERNRKCEVFVSEEMNALSLDWIVFAAERQLRPFFFLNFPYSRGNPEAFTAKARETMARYTGRGLITCLGPSYTGDGWFQKNVFDGAEVTGSTQIQRGPLKGRVLTMQAPYVGIEVIFLAGRKTFEYSGEGEALEFDTARYSSAVITYSSRPR